MVYAEANIIFPVTTILSGTYTFEFGLPMKIVFGTNKCANCL